MPAPTDPATPPKGKPRGVAPDEGTLDGLAPDGTTADAVTTGGPVDDGGTGDLPPQVGTPAEAASATSGDLAHGSLAHALHLVRELFDAKAYAYEYPDVVGDAETLLQHFCKRGWREGRNPHAGFDTVSYLNAHPDVAAIGWNPFYHYVLAGHTENRLITPAFMPRSGARALLGRDPGDCVAMLRPEVDEDFYAGQLDPPPDGSFDLVAHFAFRGWFSDHSPNHRFNVPAALNQSPELLIARVNPLLATIMRRPPPAPVSADEEDPGLHTTRFPRKALFGIGERLRALADGFEQDRVGAAFGSYDAVERLVADSLDSAHYLAAHPDVREHGMNPVEHYCRIGWLEGRNPAAWFDTSYYLEANADVAASGTNPFWHYLVEGQAEGREPRRPGGFRRTVIESALDPDERTQAYRRQNPRGVLPGPRVERLLRLAWEPSQGLVLSLSHDCYVRVTGGIQLFIAEEQMRFARERLVYVHLSPFVSVLRLLDPTDTDALVNLVIDGRFHGVASYTDITAALNRMVRREAERRLFLVHCLLGHHALDVAALQRASASDTNVFWVHDYSSICIGYTLLRNDVAYCHAPPPDSMSCRVCVYGERRPGHLAQLQTLFEAVPFHVVAPSDAALAIWKAHSTLPHLSAVTHEHCDLMLTGESVAARPPGQPVRIAYIGYARAHKGWPVWMELVSRSNRLGAYEFIHLASPDAAEPRAGIVHHPVATSAMHPDAMADAVRELDIDLVLVLSNWPETFSYVTYEALAGGADVICLRDSGNVADAVLRRGRGVVFDTEQSLFAFFSSLRAVEYVRMCREQGGTAGYLVREGTTATMAFAAS